MSQFVRACFLPRLFAAIAILLGAMSFAYAPPAPRVLLPRAEPRPSFNNDPHSLEEQESNKPGSNENSRRVEGWSIGGSEGTYSLRDGLKESQYFALLDIVKENPSWSRLELSKWRSAGEPVGVEELYPVLNMLGNPLPGLELALFLDPGTFMAPRKAIIDAWSERPRHREMPADKALIDNFLEGYSGKTLLLVGHVESVDFVMLGPDEKSTGTYNVPELIEKARAHNVLLVPIGCKTGEAGAPFGFMQNIDTDQVQNFLRTLPAANATVGDLFVALQTIAPLQIDIAAARNLLELAVIAPGNKDPGVRAKMPLSLPQQNAPNSASSSPVQIKTLEEFQQNIESRAVRYFIYDLPWGWITLSGFAILVIAGYLDEIPSNKWFFTTRLRTDSAKLVKLTGVGCAWIGLVIMLVSAVYFFVVNWIGDVLIVATLLSMFYIGAWTKHDRNQSVASAPK